MRHRSLVFATVGLLALAACAATDSSAGPPAAATSWRELPGSPLTPREMALGLWTGREVLILGGTDEPCAPNADCVAGGQFADGAALDPVTGQWRRIAESPVAITYMDGVVIGQTAYILQASEDRLLTYAIDDDRWEWLPAPFESEEWYALAAAGDQLVAYLTSDEAERGEDYLYNPETGEWSALPADPLGDAFGRSMVWTGQELMLFDSALVPNPGAEEPSTARAAAYDPATGTWRRLPDSEILSTAPWVVTADGVLVNPILGGADGGEVNNWGRTYPYGGRLDPATGAWSPLPDAPRGAESSAGAFTDTTAFYGADSGLVLDLTKDAWLTIPSTPDGEVDGRTMIAAGRDLVIFGGTDWSTAEGTLLNSAWVWSPPR